MWHQRMYFFKKVSVNRIFSKSTLHRFEMNALEEDPTDGDWDDS